MQEAEVKKVARELLEKLQAMRGSFWRQNVQTRAAVQAQIKVQLNELPEDPYPQDLWEEKVEAVWQFIYHHNAAASGAGATAH